MKKRFIGLLIGVLSIGTLVGCNQKSPATIRNLTEDSLHGKITGLAESCSSGDAITFTVTPDEYFDIDEVTVNGQPATRIGRGEEAGSFIYSSTAEAGENKVAATYKVKKSVDFVDKFKLNLDPAVYDYVISEQMSSDSNPASLNRLDFKRDGIEQTRAPVYWDTTSNSWKGRAGTKVNGDDFFFNCVDGDTTHVETFNLKYTVKIRYLMNDTQESTSQVEEWGLSASYFSKYKFFAEFGREDDKAVDYTEKMKKIFTTDELNALKEVSGATHIILLSQKMAYAGTSASLSEIQESFGQDANPGKYGASVEGNGRDLAFVWYCRSKNAKPAMSEFRCLNLELIYQGFSAAVGSTTVYGDYYFKNFDAAGLSARANHRHLYTTQERADPYYTYWNRDGYQVQELKLKDLYESADKDETVGYLPFSTYCDKKTLYAVEGYVSRKVGGTSFYIQDKAEYDEEAIRNGTEKAYGIYVFTYSQTPIQKGHHVRVIGALSSYGGTFQIQGITYTNFNPNPNRDTLILDNNKQYDIVPIKLSVSELHSLQIPSVLVQITDNVYFNQFTVDQTAYDEGFVDLCEGGTKEINRYNKFYPFYNQYNGMTLYATYGDTDNSPDVAANQHDGDSLRKGDFMLRLTVDQDCLISYKGSKAYSYKFFTGGTNEYHPDGARYIGQEGTIETTFSRKVLLHKTGDEGENLGGVIGISSGYISTSWKTFKMTLKVVNSYDLSQYLNVGVDA